MLTDHRTVEEGFILTWDPFSSPSRFIPKSRGVKFKPAHIEQAVKHLQKMFWGCFSYVGTGVLIHTKVMMNSQKHKTLLEDRLAVELWKVDPNGLASFQTRKRSFHKSKMKHRFFNNNNITCLESPVNPDLWVIL